MANRKSSTLPRIAASSDTCPVDRIHAEQCQLVIALNESKREKINGWSVDQMISDRMDANAELAAALPAASIPGALFQLALLTSVIDSLLDCVDAEGEDAQRANTFVRQTVRLIYSIRRVLEKAGGIEQETIAVQFYSSDLYDPHRRLTLAAGHDVGDAS